MAIHPLGISNSLSHWNHQFEKVTKDRCISSIILPIITALGTLFLMQGFLSPVRNIDSDDFSQVSYADIPPIAILTSVSSLIYLWPIIALLKKSDRLNVCLRIIQLLCGAACGSIFPFYRMTHCLNITYPEAETLVEVESCRDYFRKHQIDYFWPNCLYRPLDTVSNFCEVPVEELPNYILGCALSNFGWNYNHHAPIDRYEVYKKCASSAKILTSDATQYTLLSINLVILMLGCLKLAHHCKKRSDYTAIEGTIHV